MLVLTGLLLVFASSALSSDVLDLSDSTFKASIGDEDIVLVEFFAPWCGHCKRLAPEYETAATALKRNDPPVPLAKVDCTEAGKEICSKNGVSGYPTLKIFRNGEFSKDYDGPRDSSGIVSYMKKQAGPSSKEYKDLESLEGRLDVMEDFLIVAFISGDDDLKDAFLKTANDMRDKFAFGHTTESTIMDKLKYKNHIVVFRPKFLHNKLENNDVVYTGAADDFYIKKFLNTKVHGRVGNRKPDNQDQFPKPLCVVYYKVDFKLNMKGTRYWRNRVMKVSRYFDNKAINFAISNNGDFSRELSDMAIESSDSDPHAVMYNDVGEKFVMKETFSVDNFKKFLEEYFEGSIEPYIKSEPIPESNDAPVKVVVGKNFKEIVNDQTKDVLIEFYAPWCGHCKTLAPKFDELAEKLKDVEHVVIAKMDATANDTPPQFKVEGFPTLYWAPMGNKKNPEKYQGGREVSDFMEFIQRKASKPVDVSEGKNKKKTKKVEL